LQQIHAGNGTKFHKNYPGCVGDITKKHFELYFSGHSVVTHKLCCLRTDNVQMTMYI